MSLIFTGLSVGNNNKSSSNYGQSLGTFTGLDFATTSGNTINYFAANFMPKPILKSTNTNITTTKAATLYIEDAPLAGTNQTIVNRYSLYIATGNAYFGGGIITTNFMISSAGATSASSSGLYVAPTTTSLIGSNSYYFTYLGAPISTGATSAAASTLFISGAPKGTSSTNPTSSYSVNVASGNVYFGGNLLIAGTLTGANIDPSTNARKSFTVNQTVFGQTLKKNTIKFPRRSVIKTSDISINITGCPRYDQTYTFGHSVPVRHVATGNATNTIAFSDDGIRWNAVANSLPNIFSTVGHGAAWNGSIWVAGGVGTTNTMAYSFDGIRWVGLGMIYNTFCRNVLWGNNIWVSIGSDTVPIKYSYDGFTWINCLNANGTPFSGLTEGICIAYNGYMWIVGGVGSTTTNIAWSLDGIYWTMVTGPFSSYCRGIVWNGYMWIAGGAGTSHTLAWSQNGTTWNGLGITIFSSICYSIKWNGNKFVAGGVGTNNSLAYSLNGIGWTGLGQSLIGTNIITVNWNGYKWLCGADTNIFGYGLDGVNWSSTTNGFVELSSSTIFSAFCRHIAVNSLRLHSITFPRNIAVGGGGSGASSGTSLMYTLDGINWVKSTSGSTIFTGYCYTIAWNGSIWLAGGDNSTMAYSSDGINWTRIYNVIMDSYSYLAWNGTMWIVTGTSSIHTLAYSYDGFTWVGLGKMFDVNGLGIAWNGTMWVAVGQTTNNKIMYSYDGINWYNCINASNNTGSGSLFSNFATAVAWNGSMWVVTGGQTTGNMIVYSYDGIYWYNSSNGASMFSNGYARSVAWNGSMWVVVGYTGGSGTRTIAYSYDGITWTAASTNPFGTGGIAYHIAWINNLWVVMGGGGVTTVAYSYNGINWTNAAGSNFFTNAGRCSAWTAGLGSVYIQHPCLAFGRGTNSIAYSPDGLKWYGVGSQIFTTYGICAAWNGSIWVAGGMGTNTLAWSQDGITWTGLGSTIFSTFCENVIWNGSLWVAVGSGDYTIAWSLDGKTWTGVSAANGGSILTAGYAIDWNGTIFLAAGTGSGSHFMVSSVDGKVWYGQGKGSFTSEIRTVTWVGVRWIIGGVGGSGGFANQLVQYSAGYAPTGWTAPTTSSIFSSTVQSAAWNGTRIVIVGSGTNTIMRSDDNGVNWSAAPAPSVITSIVYSVVWNGRAFIAAGDGTNRLAYSGNGINWSPVPNSTNIFTTNCYGVAANSRIGATVVDSQIIIDQNGFGQSDSLDVVSDSFYNTGYDNFSVNFKYSEI